MSLSNSTFQRHRLMFCRGACQQLNYCRLSSSPLRSLHRPYRIHTASWLVRLRQTKCTLSSSGQLRAHFMTTSPKDLSKSRPEASVHLKPWMAICKPYGFWVWSFHRPDHSSLASRCQGSPKHVVSDFPSFASPNSSQCYWMCPYWNSSGYSCTWEWLLFCLCSAGGSSCSWSLPLHPTWAF